MRRSTPTHLNRWVVFSFVLFCLIWTPHLLAQDPGGRMASDFQMNLIPQSPFAFHGQQPPFEWAAVYANTNPLSESGETLYLLDSAVCGTGIPGTLQFSDDLFVSYEYDQQGRLSTITFSKDEGNGPEPFSKKSFSYANQEVSYLYQLWDAGNSSWKDDYEELTTFDGNGRQISFQIRETSSNGTWKNLFRETRAYDNDNNLVQVKFGAWDGATWKDTARKEIVYNALGMYTHVYDLSLNGTAWDTLSHAQATYEQFGLLWSGFLFEEMTPSGLQPRLKETYTYDSYGFWTGVLREMWNTNTQSWDLGTRDIHTYSRKGIWTSWTQQQFDGSLWKDHLRQQAAKAGNMRTETYQMWNETTQSWEDISRMMANINSDQLVTEEAGLQQWNPGAGAWENDNSSKSCRYVYSANATSSVRPQIPGMECLVSNPYRVYEPVNCPDLKGGSNYQLRLMDMQGRIAYRQEVKAGQMISVDRRVPQGVYTLMISEGAQPVFTKKLLINP